MGAEADEAEWCWGHEFEVGRCVDLLFQELCDADMLADTGSETFLPEITDDHPKFERPETASEGVAVIHQVRYLIAQALRITEIFGDEAECSFEDVWFACVEDAA